MSSINQDKVWSEPKSKKCPVCETYQRKIEEVEQSLSGRDAIISLLQNQLKKCESNYKNLFDDFEKLRFEHCTALQDNFSLKEINAKLEDFSVKSSSKNNPQYDENTFKRIEKKRICQESNYPVIQEVNNIENLVNTQNQILKQLLEKIIKEIKFCKCDNKDISEDIIKLEEDFKNIESGDYLNTDPEIRELSNQVETLKTLLNQYKDENDRMKQLLHDKKNSLSVCQNILQDTSASINNISSNIDSLVKDNSTKKMKESCCDTKDQNTMVSNIDAEPYRSKVSQMEADMKKKEKEYDICKCSMFNQMNDIADNNQILSDTLEIIKAENKNNLDTVAKLKEELKKVNEECETKQFNMKCRFTDLENELEFSKINEKKLRESFEISENDTKQLKERMKMVLEENSKLKECRCEGEFELRQKIAQLECANDEMRKDLTEKTLELAEYEDENRALGQQKESLMMRNNDFQRKIDELEQQLYEKSKEAEDKETHTQMSPDFSYVDLNTEISQLKEETKCLGEKCRTSKDEVSKKTAEIEYLKNSIRMQMVELDQLGQENSDLRDQMERQKIECKKETERLQSLVKHSQQQVDVLLKEHDEKTAQIQGVANELDVIRKSVTEENNTFLAKIGQLERERNELKKKVEDYESNPKKDCNCEQARVEIEKLKSDLIKKQCVILELEKTMDNFNDTMKQFDQNIGELACENACLKSDRDRRVKDLECLQSKLGEKIMDIEAIQRRLDDSELVCENCSKQSKCLEQENAKMKCQLDKLKSDQERRERSLKTDNLELQMELESVKQDQSKRNSCLSGKLESCQKAYDDVKNQCAKKCFENEKLMENLQNNKRIIDDIKKTCDCLQSENDKLKRQNRESIEEQYKLGEKMENLKDICDKMKRNCTMKCVENEDLKGKVDQACRWSKDNEELRRKLKDNEKQLSDINEKCNELEKTCGQKCQELRKVRKQWESSCKQCQISRDEYNNLRKEYKEIKSMLSDQIKRYKRDTGSIEANPTSKKNCQIVCELKKLLVEKENQISALQQKLKDSSYEIIELKDYIHKLISDNNILKSAINNLIGNLERKIKGPSFGSLPSNSADVIAGEILQSLTAIETTIIKKSNTCYPPGCPVKECDCMSEIQSQYNVKEPEQGPSKPTNLQNKEDCCFKKKPYVSDPCLRSTSNPSEPSTTDSEDCCARFLDKRSVEFLKNAIQELKTKKDSIMKEKSCDCEQYNGCTSRKDKCEENTCRSK